VHLDQGVVVGNQRVIQLAPMGRCAIGGGASTCGSATSNTCASTWCRSPAACGSPSWNPTTSTACIWTVSPAVPVPPASHHRHAVLHRGLRRALRWNMVAHNVAELVDPPQIERHEWRVLDAAEAAPSSSSPRTSGRCWRRWVAAHPLPRPAAHRGHVDAGPWRPRQGRQRDAGALHHQHHPGPVLPRLRGDAAPGRAIDGLIWG
jgi:hypothetical protein